ncbi:bile acid:sodium symporter family protein [Halobacillus massiliensis]|uniref:bile acid:sodium symporter family protein n=1 Tax=Halobacillus massiliensis TaxID=1926286 RepID=UPI0009E395E8|nr:bile acid:sodium symporter family protein [Halobacillus massiliensis]
MKTLDAISGFVGRTFAFWVVFFAALSLITPGTFTWIEPYITPLLGIIMFGMGLTLSKKDFQEVFRRPKDVAVGVMAQFILMPVVAFLLVTILPVSTEVAVGVILVGCCPGGTASNVITYLSKGDTALSVAITSVSTLLAPILTPALMYLFASQWLPVSAGDMFISIVNVVLFPIILGLVVRTLLGNKVKAGVKSVPLISVIAIVAIVAAVIGINQEQILQTGPLIFAIVALHNIFGYIAGYSLAKLFKMPAAKKRAVAIEVGMQNSGLGASLASVHFSPLSAVPSAIFSVWHNISGPILATIFRKQQEKEKVTQDVQNAS